MTILSKRLGFMLLAVALLLFIPFIAMQFSRAVDWSVTDFIIMAVLLLSTAGICELVLRKVKSTLYRVLLCCAAILVFILIWAELAVGILGTPFAGS